MFDFGIGRQALAVAAFANVGSPDGGWQPERAWDGKRYACTGRLRPWYNGRERGVVFQFTEQDNQFCGPQLNVAVFEHRNSDAICAVSWVSEWELQAPSVEDVPDGIYETKWDVSHEVGCGQVREMADWVLRQFEEHYGSLKPALERQKARSAEVLAARGEAKS